MPRPNARLASFRLDELAVFAEVAAAGSLAAAARRLQVPKSTVGRAIARVERDLGVALVRRLARGPALTDAGVRLASLAAPHIAALRDLSAAVETSSAHAYGTLRVTAPSDIGAILTPLVASFIARHPRVNVELELTLRVVDIAREGFDLAVRVAMDKPLPSSALVARKLARLDLGLYAGASYRARHPLPKTIDDLAQHAHVLFQGREGRGTLRIEGPDGRIKVPVHGQVSANDFFCIREAIAAGVGIGPLPWFLARTEVASGRLVRVLPQYSAAGTTAYLVHASAEPMPAKLKAFRDHLLEQAPELLTHP